MGRSKFLFDFFVRLWPLGKIVARLGLLPLPRWLLRPFFGQEENRSIVIPIHEVVRGEESIVLPFSLLPQLIGRAGHRFVLDHCMCRRAEGCQDYPREVGCLFLGEGATAINPALGRPVGVDEALAHVRQAMQAGLVPLVVHSAFDSFVLGIPFRRMLTICFCCDCCCTVRYTLRQGPPAFWDTVLRLPGLVVTIGDGCTGCGTCLELCHVRALSLQDGRATIAAHCKGCGRCAAACPAGAIQLHLEEGVDTVAKLTALVEERTDIA